MNFSKVFDFLVQLQREQFTGSVTFNYHNGAASAKVEVKTVSVIKEQDEAIV